MKDYEKNYLIIKEASLPAIDVLNSEDYEDMAIEKKLKPKDEIRDEITRLQLAMEDMPWKEPDWTLPLDKESAEGQHKADIRKVIQDMLEPYEEYEKSGYLLRMINEGKSLLGKEEPEKEIIQIAQMSLDEQESVFSEILYEISLKVLRNLADSNELQEKLETAIEGVDLDEKYDPELGAAAAYLSSQIFPEAIGAVSSSVEYVDEMDDSLSDAGTIRVIAYILLSLAAIATAYLLIGCVIGTGFAVAVMVMEKGAELSFALVAKMFLELITLFATELKIAIGTGIIACITGAVVSFSHRETSEKLPDHEMNTAMLIDCSKTLEEKEEGEKEEEKEDSVDSHM